MSSEAVFNKTAFEEVTDGDTELENQLLQLFSETAERCLERMQAIAGGEDESEWPMVVHELKGAAGNMQARKLAEACQQAEPLTDAAMRRQAHENVRVVYEEFIRYFKQR